MPIKFVKLPEDAKGIHYGLFYNASFISVISHFVKGDDGQFRKFATVSYQRKGFGRKLLVYLLEDALKVWT
ncbi:hypothetical protein [Xanthovirga aplysinae]|uniref:hypothetical protein n=1 Tax=Xanthovirga aplysinae TaxID=2529853 RepID=UPI0012BD7B14|nr:hypothetical protein [Xanthovirga aplysinae]MTI30462.1 hypothetical protein [Xanthovirga aplysinae]